MIQDRARRLGVSRKAAGKICALQISSLSLVCIMMASGFFESDLDLQPASGNGLRK
jgi:hypothetical protein